MVLRRLTILACLALALLPVSPGGAQPGAGALRERAESQRAREATLAGGAARLGALIGKVERQLSAIERRRANVQAELVADEARLVRTRERLRSERARLARLRARLDEARAALRQRLVALYKTSEPDLATIALSANGLGEVVERTTFLKRIRDQDERIVGTVRRARADSKAGVRRLARDEAGEREAVAAIRARRDALVSMVAAAAGRRAALDRARATRLAALRATQSSRRGMERRIRSLEAAEVRRAAWARATTAGGPAVGDSSAGGGGGAGGGSWAIPWAIVECESGGQNLPPNGAGASGYYQIVPGTWRQYGGAGPAAWKASKGEQDRVAARIWNGGAGASQWVCAALV